MAEPQIAAQFLRHVANCVELTGHSAASLLARIGVTRAMLEDPDGLIPLANFIAFFEDAAELVRNPHFGLHVGRLRRGEPFLLGAGAVDHAGLSDRRRLSV